MGAMASQITSLSIVYSDVYSGVDQRKYQSSASLPFVWGIHRWRMLVTQVAKALSAVVLIFFSCYQVRFANMLL